MTLMAVVLSLAGCVSDDETANGPQLRRSDGAESEIVVTPPNRPNEQKREGAAAEPAPTEPKTTGDWMDEDSVRMKYPRNPNGSAWRLGTKDPNTDPEVVLRFAESVTKNGDHWTATPEPDDDLTFRINIHVTASQGNQEADHDKLAAQGFMVSPKDLKNLEMTGYFRVHGIRDATEAISAKVRGGQHTGDEDPRAACIGLLVEYTDASRKLWEKELFHPTTPKTNVDRLITHGDLEDKWIGIKAIVYNVEGNTKAVSESWIDTDPFDANGKPKNQWQKVFEYVDQAPGFGGRVVTWGGKYATWRIDQADLIDFKLLSVHEIVPPRP